MKVFFNSLSISNKLAAVFLCLLFMMGLGGFVGLYNAGSLADLTRRLYQDSFKRSDTLSVIENELLSVRQELFLHIVITDQASKSFLEGSIAERRAKINKLLVEYKGFELARGASEQLHSLEEGLGRYWRVHLTVEEISRAGRREAALSFIKTEGAQGFVAAHTALKKLIEAEKDTAFNAYRQSESLAGRIKALTLILTIVAIIAAAGMWLILTRSLVRPILAIGESARKVGAGNLGQRAQVMSEDEIGALAQGFNSMAANLENYYLTLEKRVEERTEELKVANAELFKKKQELETANLGLREANRMKSQFLANVSHELRTPLNSIIGFSELLQEKAFGDLNDRQMQYVEYVHSSGNHLLSLINNILDLSKIEAGRMELIEEDFSIMEVLGETLGMVRPLAHKRGITIESKAVPASPRLRADKAKFKQIMMNLLSNAIKFNRDGGLVTVDWSIEEEAEGMRLARYVVFRISDTGIGIKPEDMGKLFKEFEQIDSSLTREYGGTGLGLVLTKRLVELHRGTIRVESTPGQGTTFFVKLPQGTEAIDIPPYDSKAFSSQTDGGARHLVLIAAEGPDINHLLEIYLAGGPYETASVADGVELVRRARAQKPFAIIMGITIPKKDGWEVLRELKGDPSTNGVPVIIVSSTDNREMGYTLGAAEYLEKPIDKEKLMAVLWKLRMPNA